MQFKNFKPNVYRRRRRIPFLIFGKIRINTFYIYLVSVQFLSLFWFKRKVGTVITKQI